MIPSSVFFLYRARCSKTHSPSFGLTEYCCGTQQWPNFTLNSDNCWNWSRHLEWRSPSLSGASYFVASELGCFLCLLSQVALAFHALFLVCFSSLLPMVSVDAAGKRGWCSTMSSIDKKTEWSVSWVNGQRVNGEFEYSCDANATREISKNSKKHRAPYD